MRKYMVTWASSNFALATATSPVPATCEPAVPCGKWGLNQQKWWFYHQKWRQKQEFTWVCLKIVRKPRKKCIGWSWFCLSKWFQMIICGYLPVSDRLILVDIYGRLPRQPSESKVAIAVGCPWDALACMAKRPVPSEAKTAQCRQKQQAPCKAQGMVAVAGNVHLGSMGSMGSMGSIT